MTATPFLVLVTGGAERDLEAIHEYIAESDSSAIANRIFEQLLGCIESLAQLPERGTCPRELAELGIRDYRQIIFKPYRIIYRLSGQQAVVYLVADSRRDMQTLLTQRILG